MTREQRAAKLSWLMSQYTTQETTTLYTVMVSPVEAPEHREVHHFLAAEAAERFIEEVNHSKRWKLESINSYHLSLGVPLGGH